MTYNNDGGSDGGDDDDDDDDDNGMMAKITPLDPSAWKGLSLKYAII